ncbi:hypothetical protein FHX42_004223 [Saccharopolyspora lacisalsi]|uniref:Neutral/alkaline non-lysosomal ceramidase N-terminal domain-containing protein n=1 Tax=Halosaccharopolyspora lacisalsi TaxID=1000566 RepID=A0A839DZA7_9PSEU|nr:neutral/alkaline non-lysosomal ceramidase N-terminal domain-containing protein [Halosaccharopolyspora lacisalsi]MBA8826844.1 hypothetical protein [Halosaccharopolyspora lacisalsi]
MTRITITSEVEMHEGPSLGRRPLLKGAVAALATTGTTGSAQADAEPSAPYLVGRGDGPVGVINWFATHATSLSPDNTLISGDNKGYAAYRWEQEGSGVDHRSGEPGFVAAFAQSNSADMSPNLALKPGTGPTDDEFANTRIIGRRQYEAAAELARQPGRRMRGGVDFRTSHVDMSAVTVLPEFTGDGRTHSTCEAVLGAAFAAGAEDGPGPSIFEEGAGTTPSSAPSARPCTGLPPSSRTARRPRTSCWPSGRWAGRPRCCPSS